MINKDIDIYRQIKKFSLYDTDKEYSDVRLELLKFYLIKGIMEYHPSNGINVEININNAFHFLKKEAEKYKGMTLN